MYLDALVLEDEVFVVLVVDFVMMWRSPRDIRKEICFS